MPVLLSVAQVNLVFDLCDKITLNDQIVNLRTHWILHGPQLT